MSRRSYDLFWMSKTLTNLETYQLELKNHYLASSAYVRWGDQLFCIKETEKAIFEDMQISLENLKEFDRRVGISELSGQYNNQKRKYSARRALRLEEVMLIESILSECSTSHVQKSKRYQEVCYREINLKSAPVHRTNIQNVESMRSAPLILLGGGLELPAVLTDSKLVHKILDQKTREVENLATAVQ